jgi:hypothetical protein
MTATARDISVSPRLLGRQEVAQLPNVIQILEHHRIRSFFSQLLDCKEVTTD